MKNLPKHPYIKVPEYDSERFASDNEMDVGGHMSSVYTSVACMERHNDPRDIELNPITESTIHGMPAWRAEQRLLSSVHRLIEKGCQIRSRKHVSERLDSFVHRHAQLLQDS